MTGLILGEFGADTVESLLHMLTRRQADDLSPERAAPYLVAEAERGDAVAAEIVGSHGSSLAAYVLVAKRRVGMTRLHRLVLAGTVLQRSRVMADALIRRVQEDEPGVDIVAPRLIPAAGAVLLSMDRARIPVTAEVLERLLAAPFSV
jgi:N-acetylglucosamine kinase-like BadF-type ATPase